jgi:hypothetical protein
MLRAPVATLRYWRHLRTGLEASGSAAASPTASSTSALGSRRRTTAAAPESGSEVAWDGESLFRS